MFTLGAAATIDASGTGRLSLTNAGAIGFTGSGARTLTLTGSQGTYPGASGDVPLNAGANNLLASIANGPGGATSLVKSGTGWWLIGGNNTYTGGTVVNGGILDCYTAAAAGTGGTNIPMPLYNTSLGAATNTVTVNSGGAITLWGNAYAPWITTQALVTLNGGTIVGEDGYQMLNAPVNFTTDSTITCRWWDKDFVVNGNVIGTGNLTINGTLPAPYPSGSYNYGAVILAGSGNTWTGQTIVTAQNAANQSQGAGHRQRRRRQPAGCRGQRDFARHRRNLGFQYHE